MNRIVPRAFGLQDAEVKIREVRVGGVPAVVRARVGDRLTISQERAAVRALRRFARRCYVVAVTDEVLARVPRPFPVEPVRTLAVHIATAESLGEPPQLVAIVTRGIRVRENATVLGYAVE